MSQQALADAMRERGFKWSQSTVWSVEKGDRPLRLAEAEALGGILNVLPVQFLWGAVLNSVARAKDELRVSEEFLTSAAQRYMDAQFNAKHLIEHALDTGILSDRHPWARTNWPSPISVVKRAVFVLAQDAQRDDENEAWDEGYGTVDELLTARVQEARAAGFENIREYELALTERARKLARAKAAEKVPEESTHVVD